MELNVTFEETNNEMQADFGENITIGEVYPNGDEVEY
jgi:hypothetical protein